MLYFDTLVDVRAMEAEPEMLHLRSFFLPWKVFRHFYIHKYINICNMLYNMVLDNVVKWFFYIHSIYINYIVLILITRSINDVYRHLQLNS